MSNPPTHVRTALSLLSTFDHMDIRTNLSLRSPDCTWHMLPRSLGYPPSMTNDEHEKHLTFLAGLLERFPVEVLEWWEGEGSWSGRPDDAATGAQGARKSGKTVSVLAKGVGVFKREVRDDPQAPDAEWSFHNEYIFVFEFNDDGTKVSRVLEMLDSAAVKGVQGLLGRAVQNLQSRKEEGKGGE